MATRDVLQTEMRPGVARAATGRRRAHEGGKLADALAWFSVGLGAAEIFAPEAVCKAIGAPRRTMLMRLMGLREMAAGVGILKNPQKANWLWARVGGDILDLALLAAASQSKRAKPGRVSAALAAVAGVTVLDVVCAQQFETRIGSAVHSTASTIVNRRPEECYRYWRDIEKLPAFLQHLRSVRVTGERRSHWIAKGPVGKDISWDAEITEDIPNERIVWRSLEGSEIRNSGSVQFQPARRGENTIVRVRMNYELPTRAGRILAGKLLGRDPGLRIRKDLLRFKQILETGEIATTEGQPAGRPSSTTMLDRMARI